MASALAHAASALAPSSQSPAIPTRASPSKMQPTLGALVGRAAPHSCGRLATTRGRSPRPPSLPSAAANASSSSPDPLSATSGGTASCGTLLALPYAAVLRRVQHSSGPPPPPSLAVWFTAISSGLPPPPRTNAASHPAPALDSSATGSAHTELSFMRRICLQSSGEPLGASRRSAHFPLCATTTKSYAPSSLSPAPSRHTF
mmetsp:Transcript_8824/g.30763  ORF Transcript_8824/g.30763 Transcript_8824/m.30763 type:complete len:202 (+) Transcript_8824:323-928(+)